MTTKLLISSIVFSSVLGCSVHANAETMREQYQRALQLQQREAQGASYIKNILDAHRSIINSYDRVQELAQIIKKKVNNFDCLSLASAISGTQKNEIWLNADDRKVSVHILQSEFTDKGCQ